MDLEHSTQIITWAQLYCTQIMLGRNIHVATVTQLEVELMIIWAQYSLLHVSNSVLLGHSPLYHVDLFPAEETIIQYTSKQYTSKHLGMKIHNFTV